MTRADAERQLGRVDELARRLRSMGIVGTVAVGSAIYLSVPALLAWLPHGVWAGPGSFLPLAIAIGLIGVPVLFAVREMRAARQGRLRALVREAECSVGLRAGELTGARELVDTPPGGSRELAEMQRIRVARVLAPFPDSKLIPRQDSLARRRLGLSVGSAAIALSCLALTFGLRPIELRAAAGALARPWELAFPPPPPPMRLELLDGPVLRGEPARLRVHAPGRILVALNWRTEGEPVRSAGVSIGDGRTAVGRTGPVRSDLSVWVEDDAGRSSDTLLVQPADPLLATDLKVITESPGWRGGGKDTIAGPVPPLTLQSGTTVRVVGRTNYPLRTGYLVPSTDDATISLHLSGSNFEVGFEPESDGMWSFEFVPDGAVPGIRPPPPLELSVLQDRAPVVRVIRPGRDIEVSTERLVPLVVDASDDIGLRSIELLTWRISAAGIEEDRVSRQLASVAGEQRRVIQGQIDLAPLPLAPGDTLFYQVLARDGNPATRTATSKTWKVVVPSIAELRRSATDRTGELADHAAVLADEVAELRREAAEAAAGMTEDSGRQGASGFEATEEARAIEQLGQEAEARMQQLERDLTELSEGLKASPVSDPALSRRVEELSELLRELRESGLSERIRALEEALRNLDRSAARDALEQVARTAEDLERQVNEAADLMERVATEQALKDAAADAADLAERQSRAAESMEQSAEWAAEEGELASAADALAERIGEVSDRLEAQGADAPADSVVAAEAALRAGAERMREAAGRDGTSRPAEDAAESLQDAARRIEEASKSLSADWRLAAVDALDGASRQALDLAREQAVLSERMKAGEDGREMASRQDAIARGLDQVLEELSDASRKTALIDRRTGPTAARARRNMQQLSRDLSDGLGTPATSSAAGLKLAEELNELSGRLRASRKAMESAESGTGMEEALEQLARMSQAQAGLNRDAGGLLMLAGAGTPAPLELAGIADRQQQIAEQLQALAEEPAAGSLPGRPEALSEEAADIARSLREAGIDRETIKRQERLFRSLLDSGRTLERDPDPERRESTTAVGRAAARPGNPLDGALAGTRYPYPDESALKGVTPTERRLILDYFDRLNRTGSGDLR